MAAAPAAAQQAALPAVTEPAPNSTEIAALTTALSESQASAAHIQGYAATLQAQIAALEAELRSTAEAATRNADSLDAQAPPRALRHRLPAERASVTHKFALSGHEGYLTVGLYPNGTPGEIFIRMAKEGSTISGLMDSFATAISMCLQHGVPLKLLCEKFAHTRFEPSGWTGNPDIGYAKSIMDYIFRWMQLRFLSGHQLSLFQGLSPAASVPVEGAVTGPANRIEPLAAGTPHSMDPEEIAVWEAPGERRESVAGEDSAEPHQSAYSATGRLASLSAGSDASPQAVLEREARDRESRGKAALAGAPFSYTPREQGSTAAEPGARNGASASGVASDLAARSGLGEAPARGGENAALKPEDRGLYAPAEAMRSMYDMGDAPSCATCGAIMTRSGSCYRCMSCGSTSGCS
jgi:ribonucleoside-diphosphate reductase alpha chain